MEGLAPPCLPSRCKMDRRIWRGCDYRVNSPGMESARARLQRYAAGACLRRIDAVPRRRFRVFSAFGIAGLETQHAAVALADMAAAVARPVQDLVRRHDREAVGAWLYARPPPTVVAHVGCRRPAVAGGIVRRLGPVPARKSGAYPMHRLESGATHRL